MCPLPNLPAIVTMFEIKSGDSLRIVLYRHTVRLPPKPVQLISTIRVMEHHRLVGCEVIGHNCSETPRRFRRFLEKFVNLHRMTEGECRSGFGKFVCEMMEGDRLQSSDCEDGVTHGNEAAMGVVGQTGIREHPEAGHVGKLEKTIPGSFVLIKRL